MARFPQPPLAISALSPLPFNFLSRVRIAFLIQHLSLELFQPRQEIVYRRCWLPPLHLVCVWATLLGLRAIHHFSGLVSQAGRAGAALCCLISCSAGLGEQHTSCALPDTPGTERRRTWAAAAGANRSLCRRVKWFLCSRDQEILNRGHFFWLSFFKLRENDGKYSCLEAD